MKTASILSLLAIAAATAVHGGPPLDKTPAPVSPKVEENPLSFYDGRLTFDFQERLRFEVRSNNFDFNNKVNSVTDDSWWLQRARIGMKVAPSDWFTFYVQGQSTFEFDSERPNNPGVLGAEGDNAFDLRQAYIQLGPKNFNLTIGRQILSYGDERLIGAFDWNNFGRTFDAVKLHYAQETWNIDAFASSVVVIDKNKFDHSDLGNGNNTGRNEVFSGIYFSSTGLIPVQTTDIYALELHENYSVGDTDFVTLGTRMKADPKKLGGWDYETEMAVQFGDVKGKDLSAFAGHWGGGYVWLDTPWKPRLGLEYNYATGDSNAKDGKVGTFQNLFPTNHLFYGYMDLFSWQNIHNPAVSFSVQPTKDIKAKLDFHGFWLAETTDAWYRANGTTAVRPINARANSFAGTELDATMAWKATKNLALQLGYSHFFAGNYLKATGANDDADFAYLQATVDF